MNIAAALSWGNAYLESYKIESPHLEAEILLAHAAKTTRSELIIRPGKELSRRQHAFYQEFISRRAKHEPTAYITGYQPFMGLDFFVDRSVLIPRPETELLVETALKQLTTILDLGTGSGCIAVTLAKLLPNANVVGVDSSPKALKVARKNAKRHQVANRCQFILGDLFQKLTTKTPRHQEFNLIISNPPYIPTKEIETLQPEVRDWEPRQALDGGKDGLKYIRQLLSESSRHLKSHGLLIFEFGCGQADDIMNSAEKSYNNITIIKDLSGHPRIFVGMTGNRDV